MTPSSDRAEVVRAVALLVESGSVVELRAPNSRSGTLSGYFSDTAALVEAALGINGSAAGVFLTLNPCAPALHARAADRIKPYAKATTGDADIVVRRWMLLDFDPIRPSGISSTDGEHEAAIAAARAGWTWLTRELGFPAQSIVAADSGNGSHLLVKLDDLPNTPEATALVRRCLEAAALYLNTETVQVDVTTFNASRIAKLYGTLTAKGDATPDRPHRVARILTAPDPITPVTRADLERLAALRPDEPAHTTSRLRADFDVRAWLASSTIPVVREKPWTNGATVLELAACPLGDHAHHRNEAVVILLASGMVLFSCRHQTCAGRTWADLRTRFDPEYARRRDHARASAASDGGTTGDERAGVLISAITVERVAWLWEPRVALGKLTILEGRPDEGKTTVAVDIAARTSAGLPMPTDPTGTSRSPAGVVLLSAEDGLADTLKPRLVAAGADCTRIVSALPDALPTLDEAGLAYIRALVARVDAKLIIVDPLMAFVPDAVDTYKDHCSRRLLRKLSALAEETGAAVLALRHVRKGTIVDPRDAGGGSVAFGGASRSVMLAGADPNDDSKKVLARVKGNLAPPYPSLSYELVAAGLTVRVRWRGEVQCSSAEVLAQPASADEAPALDEAKAVILDLLAEGPIEADAAVKALKKLGIAERTWKRAKLVLGVPSRLTGFGKAGVWWWHPPQRDTATDRECHSDHMAPSGETTSESPPNPAENARECQASRECQGSGHCSTPEPDGTLCGEAPEPSETTHPDTSGNGADPPPHGACGFCRSTTWFARPGGWVCGGCRTIVDCDPEVGG